MNRVKIPPFLQFSTSQNVIYLFDLIQIEHKRIERPNHIAGPPHFSTRLIIIGIEGRVTSSPSTTGVAIPVIFHSIFFSECSNLKEDIKIDNTTSAKVESVNHKRENGVIKIRTHLELRELETAK